MTLIAFSIFGIILFLSFGWWVISDIIEKRQHYWYDAWRKCNGELQDCTRKNKLGMEYKNRKDEQ